MKSDDENNVMQEKSAVVAVGRYNPPTKGHAEILKAIKSEYLEHNLDAAIVVIIEGKNTSKDKMKNPLTASQRIKYLERSNEGKGIKFIVASDAFDAFVQVRKAGYEPRVVVGGELIKDGKTVENRAKKYKEMLDKYFTDDGKEIEHRAVTLKREVGASDVQGISGTVVRAAVMADRYDDFADWVDFDDEDTTLDMYNELKTAFGLD